MNDGWVSCPGCGTPNAAYGDYMCGKCEKKYAESLEQEQEWKDAENAYYNAFVTCFISCTEEGDKPSVTQKKVRYGATSLKGLAKKKYNEASKIIVAALKKGEKIPYPKDFYVTW